MRKETKRKETTSSEFRRGYRSGKKAMDEYRSFKKIGDEYYGYKKSGNLERIGKLSFFRDTKGFGAGWYKALKEAIKARPTKTRRKTQTSLLSGKYKLL